MSCEEEDFRLALAEVLAAVREHEDMWEERKLEKRIKEYFRKSARGMEFQGRPWHILINEYAVFFFASLFQALGDRPWLAQADFVLALDAAVREAFPARLLAPVPTADFERAVLAAHDRAFEEQRFLPALWTLVREQLPKGGKTGKKVYDAFAFGRSSAMQAGWSDQDPNQVKAFVSRWIDSAIAHLSTHTMGDPESALPEPAAGRLLHSLLAAGALPLPLATEHGQPPSGWPFVDYTVHAAYVARGAPRGEEVPKAKARPRPRPKGPAQSLPPAVPAGPTEPVPALTSGPEAILKQEGACVADGIVGEEGLAQMVPAGPSGGPASDDLDMPLKRAKTEL